jgi:DNA-binding NarL/FixJ family response regulator
VKLLLVDDHALLRDGLALVMAQVSRSPIVLRSMPAAASVVTTADCAVVTAVPVSAVAAVLSKLAK